MERGLLSLVFLLWMLNWVKGDNLAGIFMTDIFSTLGLTLPTIVYNGGEVPEICINHPWVLCLDQENDQIDVADHIVMLHEERKQDSVFFMGASEKLVRLITRQRPSMFRSNCPTFMALELSDLLELKLDTNIIFFREEHITIE